MPPMERVRPSPPHTPVLQREPSSESINIFADPDTANSKRSEQGMAENSSSAKGKGRAEDVGLGVGAEWSGGGRMSHQTTFSDMMERADLAGLKKGEPFVPRMGKV